MQWEERVSDRSIISASAMKHALFWRDLAQSVNKVRCRRPSAVSPVMIGPSHFELIVNAMEVVLSAGDIARGISNRYDDVSALDECGNQLRLAILFGHSRLRLRRDLDRLQVLSLIWCSAFTCLC